MVFIEGNDDLVAKHIYYVPFVQEKNVEKFTFFLQQHKKVPI